MARGNLARGASFGPRMNQNRSASFLDGVEIASPCSADWNSMAGDDRRRFCAQCKLHVHDLSRMTRDEAEELVRGAANGRVCVRLYRRADGTVLTRDCPVGLRRRVRAAFARAIAACVFVWGLVSCTRSAPGGTAPTAPAVQPADPRPLQGEVEMGDAVAPPPEKPELGKIARPGGG